MNDQLSAIRQDQLKRLATGTPGQRAAHDALNHLNLFERLGPYDPVLAGTIPLDVDIASSDLDIICCARDFTEISDHVAAAFSDQAGYTQTRRYIDGRDSLIIRFTADNQDAPFPIEIFAQDRPVLQQAAVVHLLIEERLLHLKGPAAKARIRTLKSRGLKTEPAFAKVFGIDGDPYQALYDLQGLSDAELAARFVGGM